MDELTSDASERCIHGWPACICPDCTMSNAPALTPLQSVSPRTWQDIAIDVRPYLPGPLGVPQVAVTARRVGQHSMGPGMVIVEGDATTLTDEQLAEAAGQAVAKLLAAEAGDQ